MDSLVKPSTSYSNIGAIELFNFLLLENGAFLLNEDSGYYEISDESMDSIGKPSTTFNSINKPS